MFWCNITADRPKLTTKWNWPIYSHDVIIHGIVSHVIVANKKSLNFTSICIFIYMVKRSVGYATRCIEHYKYRKAFTYLYNNFPGARRAVENLLKKEIWKGVMNLLNDKEGSLLKKCNLQNITEFIWSIILTDVAKYIPLLHSALIPTVTSPSNEKSLKSRLIWCRSL